MGLNEEITENQKKENKKKRLEFQIKHITNTMSRFQIRLDKLHLELEELNKGQ